MTTQTAEHKQINNRREENPVRWWEVDVQIPYQLGRLVRRGLDLFQERQRRRQETLGAMAIESVNNTPAGEPKSQVEPMNNEGVLVGRPRLEEQQPAQEE